jgi:N-acetylneuraminic acid mutarotase
MKNIYLSATVFMFMQFELNASYVWTQKAFFPGTPRYEAVGFSIGNKGYFGTGANFNVSNIPFKDFWEWDKATNTWTQKADVPGPGRYGATAFAVDGKGYVTTGWQQINSSSTALFDIWEYNPSTDTWTQKSNFPGSPRYDAVGLTIDGYGYIGLGYGPLFNDFWKFDHLLNGWIQVASLPGPARQSASSFSINGKGYVICGSTASGSLNDTWQYNPANNTWTQLSNFPGGIRYGTHHFEIDSLGFVGCGRNGNQFYNSFYSFNPALNQWSLIASLPANARETGDGFSIGQYGYTGLGRDQFNNYYNDFWEYGPDPSGIGDNIASLQLCIFPNPASDFIYICLQEENIPSASVSVFDEKGKMVFHHPTTLLTNGFTVPVSALASGNYLLSIQTKNKSWHKNMVIAH